MLHCVMIFMLHDLLHYHYFKLYNFTFFLNILLVIIVMFYSVIISMFNFLQIFLIDAYGERIVHRQSEQGGEYF